MRHLLSDLCTRAGALLLQRFGSATVAHEKPRAGWVTEADLASEALILDGLRAADPGALIVAEESGTSGSDTGRVWYVDPLDGTTNFARGIPLFAISIAGAIDGRLSCAAIFHPTTRELFCAERGSGAFVSEVPPWAPDRPRSWHSINGRPLRVGGEETFSRCVIGTGDLYEHGDRLAVALAEQRAVYEQAMVVRAMGSVALSLAYVAAGRLDGFFFDRCNTWDVAAGLLLVQEAGGQTGSYDGADATLTEGRSIVAGNEVVVAHLRRALGGAR